MASTKMNLADPELELIDPTPNVHNLFVHFDSVFFWAALAGRALVRWSKRMYSCAGVCSYEGRNGICDIALSEPLLKLRPRKDLVETLLHEMIHAFLFITNRDNDRDGHGPNFQAHMHRINKAAGLNISIYHDFHDEVNLYLTHVWRCNGPCQKIRPYFGIVRRSCNKPPGPSDFWWTRHKRSCGGTFTKIQEPEKVIKPTKAKEKPKDGMKQKVLDGFIDKNKVVTKNNVEDKPIKNVVPPLTVHNDNVLTNRRKSMETINVVNKVRDVWKNKDLPIINGPKVIDKVREVWRNKQLTTVNSPLNTQKKTTNKHKIETHVDSPSKKMKTIDDYFKNANTILKDIYGDQIEVTISGSNNKLTAIKKEFNNNNNKVDNEKDLVDCPNCNTKVSSKDINRHLDECLNKEIIDKLTKDTPSTSQTNLKESIGSIQEIPAYKNTDKIKTEKPAFEYKNVKRQTDFIIPKSEIQIKAEPSTSYDNKGQKITEIEQKDSEIEQKDTEIDQKDTELKQKCPCCGNKVDKPILEHLDECLAFFDNNTTVPIEGNSSLETIILDDDDEFDETLTLNATGTKSPCPCCMKMVEIAEMNGHLDVCLNS